jgi:hypothetical protein
VATVRLTIKKILLLCLLIACAGCVNDFVGNSPLERQHREQIWEQRQAD